MYFALCLKIKNADFTGGLWWTVTYDVRKGNFHWLNGDLRPFDLEVHEGDIGGSAN